MKTVWIVTRIEFDGGTSYRVYAQESKAKEAVELFRGAYAYAAEHKVID